MKFHNALDDILGSPVKVGALRTLVRGGTRVLTGREIARQSSASPSQTIRALGELEATGLIYREIAGRSHVWRLADHTLRPLIDALFAGERGALAELEEELVVALRPLPVQGAWLFGSVVRHEERPGSDVDLLVRVRTNAEKAQVEAALESIAPRFAIKFGNPLSAIVAVDSGKQGSASFSSLKHLTKGATPLEMHS